MLISSTVSSLHSPTPFPLRFSDKAPNYPLSTAKNYLGARNRRRIWTLQTTTTDSSSLSSSPERNQTVTVATLQTREADADEVQSAPDIVRSFYEAINARDLASVENLISDDCVYEDLIFPRPFVGRKAVLEFFKKFIDSISTDLQFAIDDISDHDSAVVGVTWHLEWKGRPFPFSKGCSFYRLKMVDGKRQLGYGRDSVEPAIKPGAMALAAIKGVTWLLQQFPLLADQLL
uniref:Uncharacterized protein LOC105133813 isoform X1 n=1 Tax=Rhizophora mucronata TaxID=61149 RepID=A0A2P2JNG4_RHIMU